eukprot:PhF_6_TR1047/c0_g1_i1/m.2157
MRPGIKTSYIEACFSKTDDHPSRDWNREFQDAWDIPITNRSSAARKRDALHRVITEFQNAAASKLATLYENSTAHALPQSVRDGDMIALLCPQESSKALRNSYNALVTALIPGINFPLTTFIRVRHLTFLVSSVAPLMKTAQGGAVLAYNGTDSDNHVIRKYVHALVGCLAEALHLQNEMASTSDNHLFLISKIEVFHGRDGRYYILPGTPLLPNDTTGSTNTVQVRPEWFVTRADVCDNRNMDLTIQEASSDWLNMAQTLTADSDYGQRLEMFLHSRGIQMRCLVTLLRFLSQDAKISNVARDCVIVEIIARTAKGMILLASTSLSDPSSEHSFLNNCNRLFSLAMSERTEVWESQFLPYIQKKYNIEGDRFVADVVGEARIRLKNILFRRMCTLTGVMFRNGSAFKVIPRIVSSMQPLPLPVVRALSNNPSLPHTPFDLRLACLLINNESRAAENLCRQNLQSMEEKYGNKHYLTVFAMHKLAEVLITTNDANAVEWFEKCASTSKELSGSSLETALYNVDEAKVCLQVGKSEEALAIATQARLILEERNSEQNVMWMQRQKCEIVIAAALSKLGRSEDAKKVHRTILRGVEKCTGGVPLGTILAYNELAASCLERKYYDLVEELYLKSREMLVKNTVPGSKPSPMLISTMNNLAYLYYVWDPPSHLASAENLMRETLTIQEQASGKQSLQVGYCLNNLASLLLQRNKLGESQSFF